MSTKSNYGQIHASMLRATKKLAPPTAPLRGNGNDRHLFIKGRRDCIFRFLEATPAALMYLDVLPDNHKALVRTGCMDIDAFVSPQAMACWRTHGKDWRRLKVWRFYTKPTMGVAA